MRFKLFKSASLMFLAAMVTACGGGGGSGNDSGFNPPGMRATATAQSTSVPAGSSTDISVRITEANGAAVRDGVAVTASVSPSSVGSVFGLTSGGGINNTNATTTAGGNANFRFVGENPGTATVSFTAQDPQTAGRTVTTSITITVTQGTPRVSMQATRTTIPINTYNIQPFFGSPPCFFSPPRINLHDIFCCIGQNCHPVRLNFGYPPGNRKEQFLRRRADTDDTKLKHRKNR